MQIYPGDYVVTVLSGRLLNKLDAKCHPAEHGARLSCLGQSLCQSKLRGEELQDCKGRSRLQPPTNDVVRDTAEPETTSETYRKKINALSVVLQLRQHNESAECWIGQLWFDERTLCGPFGVPDVELWTFFLQSIRFGVNNPYVERQEKDIECGALRARQSLMRRREERARHKEIDSDSDGATDEEVDRR